ncbi:MAG TPA: hypothetical protein VI756_05460, partial [Blastocatellia bacterium]
MFSRGLQFALLAAVFSLSATAAAAQDPSSQSKQVENVEKSTEKKDESTVPATAKDVEKIKDRVIKTKNGVLKFSAAELVAETTIIAYGGRAALKAAHAAISEEGTIRLATEQGDASGTFMLREKEGDKSWEDLLRTDLELTPPDPALKAGAPAKVKYCLAYNGASVWAAQNNQYITPSPESEAAFKSQLSHDYMSLLRYKEDGSKIDLIGPENVVGIETQVMDLTLPNGEKTRYWVSAKTYRILHMEYDLKLPDGSTGRIRVSYY